MTDRRPSHLTNLRLIEYAVALDQHRSFARAAAAIGVTQPTFSRGIAALERKFNARLFVRSSRGVEPTPAGSVFIPRAAAILADAAHLRDALDDYQGLRSGRIVVGVGPYPLELSVIECVARLMKRHPLLQIELLEGHWREFGPKLLSRVVEIAVVEPSILSADPRFEVEMLPPHAGCFFCRRGHPLASRSGVTLAEILEYSIVGVRLPDRGFVSRTAQSARLTRDSMTGDAIPHIATTSIAAARGIVKRTDGIGIAAPIQIAEDVRNETLVVLRADGSTLRSAYGIVRLREKVPTPGARAFIEVLKEVEAELAASTSAKSPAPRWQRRAGRRR